MATPVSHDPLKPAAVKVVHSVIYVMMAGATLYVFYGGITGRRERLLTAAIALVALEGLVFLANGMRCPLTSLAQKYGDPSGHVGDTLFPETFTRYTFRAFGTLYAIGVALIVLGTIA